MIDITKRKNIIKGLYVKIECDNGKEYKGYIVKVLSKGDSARGIKVTISSTLTNSLIDGVVIDVPSKNEVHKENFKFYNLFFSGKEYYSIIDENNEYILYDISSGLKRKKVILLFTNSSIAKSFISKNESFKNYTLKRISKKNTIQSNFEKLVFDCYLLDSDKLVDKVKFNELEKYFLIHS